MLNTYAGEARQVLEKFSWVNVPALRRRPVRIQRLYGLLEQRMLRRNHYLSYATPAVEAVTLKIGETGLHF
jgi:hypothetical protein